MKGFLDEPEVGITLSTESQKQSIVIDPYNDVA
jgi:hypothetical protein